MDTEPPEKHESESQKFRDFTKKIVSVPKAEIDRREKEYRKERQKKKRQQS